MPGVTRTRTGTAPAITLPRLQRSGIATFRSLWPYLWPEHDTGARIRVSLAMGLMVLAKVATVYVPIV
jgi:ATP-binding cassette, subfamily B, heavy metal transporter